MPKKPPLIAKVISNFAITDGSSLLGFGKGIYLSWFFTKVWGLISGP
jgi:hypothetical protein